MSAGDYLDITDFHRERKVMNFQYFYYLVEFSETLGSDGAFARKKRFCGAPPGKKSTIFCRKFEIPISIFGKNENFQSDSNEKFPNFFEIEI